MHAFDTVHAEPRTSIDAPRYRVNFWQRMSEEGAWRLDAHVLEGADDISEALRWIDEQASGRRIELFVEVDEEAVGSFTDPRKCGLVRLLGENPNAGVTAEIGRFETI